MNQLTEILVYVLGVIATLGVSFKGFTIVRQKKNGGTIYDKVTKLENNQKIFESRFRVIEKDVKEIKAELKELRNDIKEIFKKGAK